MIHRPFCISYDSCRHCDVRRPVDIPKRTDDSNSGRISSSVRFQLFPRMVILLLGIFFVATASGQQQQPSSDGSNVNADFFQAQPQTAPYFVRAGEPGPTLPCGTTSKYAQDSQYKLVWVKVVQNTLPRIISQGNENSFAGQYDLETTCPGCYNLKMKNVSYNEDNGRFYCQLTGPGGFVKDSIVAQVVVLVKPGPPEISGQTTGTLREGQIVSLECQSSGGNPSPRIIWKFSNGSDATGLARVRNSSDLNSPTISNLVWPVSYKENNQELKCSVWNEAMGDGTQPMEAASSKFSVQYPPKVTVGPSNPYSVEDQTEANLYCTADANPPARSYVWSYSASESASAWAPNSPTSNTQNLSFRVTRQDRGIYTCTATNDLGKGQGSLQLDVQYAPRVYFITGNNNQSSSSVLVSENQAVSVTCQPDANPPATSVGWTGLNGQKVSDNAVLNLASVSREDAGNYTCTASNTLTVNGTGSMQREGSGMLQVDVKHVPGKAIINESEAAVVGGSVNLSCTADDPGAPMAQFKWKAPGQQDYDTNPKAIYTIENIQLEKAGEYWCMPFNEVGMGQASSHRLVIYQPAQLEEHLKPEDQKREGEQYELTCTARGHPSPNITWYKDDEPIAESSDHWSTSTKADSPVGDCSDPTLASSPATDQCSYKVTGTLKWVDGIRWTDKGYVSCRAYNGAGRPAESKTLLRIQHKPVIVNDPNRPFVAAELGQQVFIECKASSNPEPTFKWSRPGQQGELTAGQQYAMNRAKFNQSYELYQETLMIKQVTDEDFGEYQCKANNQLGDGSFTFKLQKKAKPLPPEEFKGTQEKTHRSLELSWVPGFDGGYEQTFTIEQIESGMLYNVTESSATTGGRSLRLRRHVGIEEPMRARFNVTNLAPASSYSFRVKAANRLGETEWSEKISASTADAPVDNDIKKPDQAVYNAETKVLEVRPTLDPGKYCLLIYLRQSSGSWEAYRCVAPDSNVNDVPPAANMRVRFCNIATMSCGDSMDVITGVGAGVPAAIIVAICVAVVVLLALAVVIFVCCVRSRRRQKEGRATGRGFMNSDKKQEKKKQKSMSNVNSKNGTMKKDYEMETNQARPKAISGPYLTKNTPGPLLGVTSADQNTGSSKDSGVFTTSSATNNYPYDGSSSRHDTVYGAESASPGVPGAHHRSSLTNGNGRGSTALNRLPSYDGHEHWGATDGYGLAGAYLNGRHNSHRGGHDFHDGAGMEALNGGAGNGRNAYDATTPTSAMSNASAFVDPYGAVGFVDMNPNGGGGSDASGNSGYSTPTQRRVMREIIV